MWQVQFKCPRCSKKLAGKGLYNRVRTVLELKSAHYLASEYLECTDCKGTFQTWDHRLVSQLADHVAARFTCILTHTFACDKSIVIAMRSRTLNKSNASVMRRIEEYHNEGSIKGHLQYLGDYESYRSHRKELRLDVAE